MQPLVFVKVLLVHQALIKTKTCRERFKKEGDANKSRDENCKNRLGQDNPGERERKERRDEKQRGNKTSKDMNRKRE